MARFLSGNQLPSHSAPSWKDENLTRAEKDQIYVSGDCLGRRTGPSPSGLYSSFCHPTCVSLDLLWELLRLLWVKSPALEARRSPRTARTSLWWALSRSRVLAGSPGCRRREEGLGEAGSREGAGCVRWRPVPRPPSKFLPSWDARPLGGENPHLATDQCLWGPRRGGSGRNSPSCPGPVLGRSRFW